MKNQTQQLADQGPQWEKFITRLKATLVKEKWCYPRTEKFSFVMIIFYYRQFHFVHFIFNSATALQPSISRAHGKWRRMKENLSFGVFWKEQLLSLIAAEAAVFNMIG